MIAITTKVVGRGAHTSSQKLLESSLPFEMVYWSGCRPASLRQCQWWRAELETFDVGVADDEGVGVDVGEPVDAGVLEGEAVGVTVRVAVVEF
jgi:hypothetical protein